MKQTPQSYLLLHTQCDFLRSKGKNEWALKLARQAVNCAPSEFVTWEKLTDIYIDLGEYESVRSRAHIPSSTVMHTHACPGAPHAQLMSNVHVQWARRTPQPLCVATAPTHESSRNRDLARARENGRRRSGPGFAAFTSPRTARNMGPSLCAACAAGVANRVGRASQDAERCLRDGRGVQDAEGAGGHRCSATGRRGRGCGRRRLDKRRAYVREPGRLPHVVEC